MKYLERRQNPLENSVEEIELAFAKVAEYFDLDWLSLNDGKHVLQMLWNRRDALSTNELFTFGTAIVASERASIKWLKQQVKHIQSHDKNNQMGAAFEILALGYTAGRQKVQPTKVNQPGYDLEIETNDASKFLVSLKCYSESQHEKSFKKYAATTKDFFLTCLKRSKVNTSIYIEATSYPSGHDWQNLHNGIKDIVTNKNGGKGLIEIERQWKIAIKPLMEEHDESFAKDMISHTFLCTSPYHKNEQSNFVSKLESAFVNLSKHCLKEPDSIPIVLMRLPPTASSSCLTQWSNEYFVNKAGNHIGAVFFLQPYVASSEDRHSNFIAYYTSIAASNEFAKRKVKPLAIEFPVGVLTNMEPTWQFGFNLGSAPLGEKYFFQNGAHYLATKEKNGTISGNLKNKAPGIKSYAVIDQVGKQSIIEGRWGDELCLIGS